jgi:hypothetical protein
VLCCGRRKVLSIRRCIELEAFDEAVELAEALDFTLRVDEPDKKMLLFLHPVCALK